MTGCRPSWTLAGPGGGRRDCPDISGGRTRATPADDDPFQWLEDVQGEKALAWVKQQNAKTLAVLEPCPSTSPSTRARSRSSTRRRRSRRRAPRGHGLNFWKDEVHERGIWRRTTLASYRTASPKWETVLDVDALAKAEGKSGFFRARPACHRPSLIELSKSDAAVVREFDAKKEFVQAPCRKPSRASPGGGHGLGRHGFRSRLADDLRVPADREALEARHSPLRGEDDLRGRAGRRRRVRDREILSDGRYDIVTRYRR